MRLFRKAVVIIHGFTGNLYDNEYLMNYLEEDREFDVYAETLPGHNKDRFSDANVNDWKEAIDKLFTRLINLGYKRIYVVGHSMGGILASYAAAKYPEIKKIVFVNAAFDYFNLKQNKNDLKEKDFSKFAKVFPKVFRTSPIMLNEFRKLVKEGSSYLKKVSVDALILRSPNDGIIPYDVGDLIYNEISSENKCLTDILGASHTVLSGDKKETTSEYIKLFLKGGRKWKKNIKKEI